jgi:hypothetical protein
LDPNCTLFTTLLQFPAGAFQVSVFFKRTEPGLSKLVAVPATSGILPGIRKVFAGTAGKHWYVAPDGLASNTGDASSPIDLVTAFGSKSATGAVSNVVKPGDTVWLREGVYRGVFTSHLEGDEAAPILVAQYPGERATIENPSRNGAPTHFSGSWTWY